MPKNLTRALIAALTPLVLSTVAFGVLAAPANAAVPIPSCPGSWCAYVNKEYNPSGTPLVGYGINGSYSNLNNQGVNDALSSLSSNVGHTVRFYQDASGGGYRLDQTAWGHRENLALDVMASQTILLCDLSGFCYYQTVKLSWNDRISSIYW